MSMKLVVGTLSTPKVSSGNTLPKVCPKKRNIGGKRPCRLQAASNSEGDSDLRAQQMAQLEEAMKNPAMADQLKSMQETMAQPQVQQEMAAMAQTMQNPKFQEKIAQLREDPELKPLFDEIRSGGPMAMMKAMQDPEFLAKIGAKLDFSEMVGDSEAAAPPPPPEVNNILDAAKYEDIEAIEDFIAIGKSGDRDENQRTALHYAVAYNRGNAAGALLRGGADVNAVDDKLNTPLHYAAGYGRGAAVKALINAGASPSMKNADGQTPADVIKLEPRNPLNNDSEVMEILKN